MVNFIYASYSVSVMTNLFAVSIDYQNKPYVFCVSDSQSTIIDEKGATKLSYQQKLVTLGDNLVMATGLRNLAILAYEKLEGTNLPASKLAEAILEVTKEPAEQLKGNRDASTMFFVAGHDDKGLSTYEVIAVEADKRQRAVVPASRIYSRGSASPYVASNLEVRFKEGFLTLPETPLDAIAMCFGVGETADKDLGVNDKLQLGFVSPDSMRLLTPPGLEIISYAQCNKIYKLLTGLDFNLSEKTSRARKDKLLQVTRSCFSHYHTLETRMARIKSADLEANRAHEENKRKNRVSSKNHSAAMKRLFDEKRKAQSAVDAFMTGGIEALIQASREFHAEEESAFTAALSFK